MAPFSRRDVLRSGRDLATLLSLSTLAGVESPLAAPAEAAQDARRAAPDVYRSIGVKPVVNARGTFTIISGSLMLPEVRAAMDAAARQYVHLDELADAVGARLATLTGAEWGLVTAGCSAALTHATAACVAGGNPDLHVRMPNLAGFAKDEVIIPRHSPNVYDAAVRVTVPNVHLENGAALVGYSGGKCLRGPQTAGLLLGRKDLVRAAWVHSAPHHGPGRAMKVGKEEAIGMLTAVEMWVKRDHDAEWKQWMAWLDHISRRLTAINGVTTTLTQPNGLSNRTPSLRLWWDPQRFGFSGETVARALFETEPRVVLTAGRRPGPPVETGVSVTPYMMSAGDDVIVGDRLHALLSSRTLRDAVVDTVAPVADVSGRWDVRIEYAAGTSTHALHLRQKGNDIDGTHQGDFVARDLTGAISGSDVRIRSLYSGGGDSLPYTFTGKLAGAEMAGELDMGSTLARSGRPGAGNEERKTNRRHAMKSNRRKFLTKASAVAAAVALPSAALAQTTAGEKPVKKVHYASGKPPEKTPLFSGIVTFGNMVFIAGIGAHFKGDIKAHTTHVLDEIQKRLLSVGSSMDKVLKVNVYLNTLDDYAGMNEAFLGRFGAEPPVRTTIAAAAGIPGNSLVEIDCIAAI